MAQRSAAAFLALGRPVITENTGAEKYLPLGSGFRFVSDAEEAETAVKKVLRIGRSYRSRRAAARWKFSIRREISAAFSIFRYSWSHLTRAGSPPPGIAQRRKKPMISALQNKFRVLLVVPLWLT